MDLCGWHQILTLPEIVIHQTRLYFSNLYLSSFGESVLTATSILCFVADRRIAQHSILSLDVFFVLYLLSSVKIPGDQQFNKYL